MELRWTEKAAADLEQIADYLFQKTPERAAELVRAIYNAPAALLTFPYQGRDGRREGTRELPLSPLPYVVV
jgi:toxin ParE1/3/4